MYILLCRQY